MSKNNQDFTLSLLKTIASVPINKKSQSNIHRIIETAEKKIGLRAERTKHLLKNLASRRLIKEVKHKGEISYRVLKTNLNKYLNSVGSTMNDVEDVLEAGVSDEELPANNDGAVANEAADYNEEGEKRIKRTTRRKVLKAVRSLWKLLNKKQAVVIVKPRSRGRPPKQKNEYNLAKTSQVGKQLEEGVSFNQIQSWFLRKWPCQVNDVKEIEMAINLEVESGRLILLPNNNYILKNWNTTLKDSNTNGDDDDDENGATNWESIIVEPEGRNISGVGNSCFIDEDQFNDVEDDDDEGSGDLKIDEGSGSEHKTEHHASTIINVIISKDGQKGGSCNKADDAQSIDNAESLSKKKAKKEKRKSKSCHKHYHHDPDFECEPSLVKKFKLERVDDVKLLMSSASPGSNSSDRNNTGARSSKLLGKICQTCELMADCNLQGEEEVMLTCKMCQVSYHPSCLSYSKKLAKRALQFPWECATCKTCYVCGDTEEARMLICDSCDRGVHMQCHDPPVSVKLDNLSAVDWMCSLCENENNNNNENKNNNRKNINNNNKTVNKSYIVSPKTATTTAAVTAAATITSSNSSSCNSGTSINNVSIINNKQQIISAAAVKHINRDIHSNSYDGSCIINANNNQSSSKILATTNNNNKTIITEKNKIVNDHNDVIDDNAILELDLDPATNDNIYINNHNNNNSYNKNNNINNNNNNTNNIMTSFSHNVSSKDSSVSIRRDNNNNTDGYADKSNINNNESNNTINNNSVIINVGNDNDGDNFYPDNDDGTVIVKKENAVDESGDTVLLPTPSSSPSRVGDGEDEASSRRFHQQCRSSSIDIPVFPKILFSVGNQAPDASNWLVEDVYNYFIKAGYPKQAETFKNEEIDGRALLLLTRADVLTGMGFKLGPALKIHAHIQRLVDASSSSTSSSTF